MTRDEILLGLTIAAMVFVVVYVAVIVVFACYWRRSSP